MLVLVLVSLALAAALVAPLALLTGTHAVAGAQRDDALAHRLAGDSLIAVLPEWLEKSSDLRRQLELSNRAVLSLTVGDVQLDAVLQDDSAKLPVPALRERRNPERLSAAVQRLAVFVAPRLQVAKDSSAAASLDELFENADEASLFGSLQNAGIADYVSTLGQRVHLHSARAEVLEAALQDIQPGIGLELARLRRLHAKEDSGSLVARLEIPEARRREATARLTDRMERFSLCMRTARQGDVRWRYVVCSASEPPEILLDWEIAP